MAMQAPNTQSPATAAFEQCGAAASCNKLQAAAAMRLKVYPAAATTGLTLGVFPVAAYLLQPGQLLMAAMQRTRLLPRVAAHPCALRLQAAPARSAVNVP